MSENPEDTQMGVGRLEAFSDGVFGVAVTLLVLNIQLPHMSSSDGAKVLISGLINLWPAYLSYFITFISLGTLWVSHHQILKYFQRVDVPLQLVNLLFLMFVALTPFTTVLLADSITVSARLRIALIVSGAVWTAMGLLISTMGRYSIRANLLKSQVDPLHMIPMSRSLGNGVIVGIVGILIGLVVPEIGVIIFVLIALGYLAPIVEVFRPRPQATK